MMKVEDLYKVSDAVLSGNDPKGPIETRWTRHKASLKLVAPNNRPKYDIIVVGTGLAGASAAASLGELGYNVKVFSYHDSARRAHSIAAQGGINAAKNYKNDNDSVFRLFYDTIKGGDFRSRESNVYRLAEVSVNIIDQCVAQGVPFAREYGGYLATRSFGGAQVSRTFYAKGQTGQQLLLGAYSALMRQVNAGTVQLFTRTEMVDLIIIDGHARGIIARNLITGELSAHFGHAVILATGGYGNIYFLSTNAKNSNGSAAWRAHKRGAFFANPCYVQAHPTCIPQSGDYQSKLTLMSESLRNHGRVWVPRKKELAEKLRKGEIKANDIPDPERWYYLEEKYPSFGNLVPRDVASRNAKLVCDMGLGVNPTGRAVFLDFRDAIKKYGRDYIEDKYGNLFEMYEKITGDDPYRVPMMIYPAVHYTMGGLWVDYNLMSNIPGLFVLGEANFSDHGANRLGASALMQGLADGYFVIPYTLPNYLAQVSWDKINPNEHSAFKEAMESVKERFQKMLNIKGTKTPDEIHRKLGEVMWHYAGISRTKEGLEEALQKVRTLREEFWNDLRIVGSDTELNQTLEKANRLSDFLELAELLIIDAWHRDESCGGHFREEYQTEEGEALRRDELFSYVAAWEWTGNKPVLHKEPLEFEFVKPSMRSYK